MSTEKTKSLPFGGRLCLVGILVAGWMCVSVWTLINLQIKKGDFYKEKARNQQKRVIKLNPRRGTVYDRNGEEMAISIEVPSIYAAIPEIENPEKTAEVLSDIFPREKLDYYDIVKKLKKDRNFVWLARQISPEKWEKIQNKSLEGIGCIKESRRYFPRKNLCAHVLGYVGIDEKGLAGIEHFFNSEIRGQSSKFIATKDAKGKKIVLKNIGKTQPSTGKDVVLTVDSTIQYFAEKELEKAISKYSASAGSVIVMNPKNGEIYAMASKPDYNPNARFSTLPENRWPNRAIQRLYEPGSTFKVVTGSVSLENNRVSPGETIYCGEGKIEIAKRDIKDHEKYSDLTFREVIANSSNVGAIKVGRRLNEQIFYSYLKKFGFGKPTGIKLPGEAEGILREASKWSKLSAASISMGQEISVTPLQMLQALNVIVNDGKWIQPEIVRQIGEKSFDGKNSHSVISKETARTMRNILLKVVEEGTGKKAAIDGYKIAGKTGTAQKIVDGEYSKSRFVASFMGFLPFENPRFSIIVVLDEPRGAYYGGQVAAPVFRKIASQILLYGKIPSEKKDNYIKTTYKKKQKKDTVMAKAGSMKEEDGYTRR